MSATAAPPPVAHRGRTLRVALPVAVVAAAAGLGLGLTAGGAGGASAPAPATAVAPPQPTVMGGGLRLTLPYGWRRATASFAVAGLAAPGSARVASDSTQVLLTTGTPDDATLLPAALRDAAAAPLPAPERVPAGTPSASGLPDLRVGALHYVGIRLRGSSLAVDAYAVPTTAGVTLVACSGADARPRAGDCERALFSTTVAGPRALTLDDAAAFRAALPAVVTRLAGERRTLRARMAGARTVPGRVAAAGALRVAYRRAALVLAPLAPAGGVPAAVAGLLTRLAEDHATLAAAARAQDPARFAAIGRAITASERTLERHLRTLTSA